MIPLAHAPPRRPHVPVLAFLAMHAIVVFVWWRLGWAAGLSLMMLTHAVFLWGTLRYDSALFGPVVRSLDTGEAVVWLTIDDGPSADTPAILDLLDRYDARATFFVVAGHVRRRPDLAREIVRRGHDLGNHSDTHPEKWFWALGPSRMRREIARAQADIERIAGRAPRWFRAVVGMANPFVAAQLKRNGLARVAWTARGYDAVLRDPQRVVARIERDLVPGAIILLHEGAAHGRNVETLARVLARLDELGYRTVLPEAQEAATPLPAA